MNNKLYFYTNNFIKRKGSFNYWMYNYYQLPFYNFHTNYTLPFNQKVPHCGLTNHKPYPHIYYFWRDITSVQKQYTIPFIYETEFPCFIFSSCNNVAKNRYRNICLSGFLFGEIYVLFDFSRFIISMLCLFLFSHYT